MQRPEQVEVHNGAAVTGVAKKEERWWVEVQRRAVDLDAECFGVQPPAVGPWQRALQAAKRLLRQRLVCCVAQAQADVLGGALAPAPLSPGLASGGGSSAEGGAAVRLAGGGSGSGPRVGCARYGQLGLRRASGRPSPPLSGVRCAALGLARFGAATDERLASEGWRTQAWPPMLASPTKKKNLGQARSQPP